MMRNRLKFSVACAALGIAMSAGGANAQEISPSEGAEVAPKRLQRIIVTSRKIEESLADAPVSVLAVSGDALSASNITEIDDLTLLAPGLTLADSANSRGRGPQIRGIGTTQFGDGVEASVATYVDGVVLGRQAMGINDLIDVERIEVLRGPQGTLFGKNASAGVINIVTKRPSLDKFGFDGSVSIANQSEDDANEVKLAASVTGPLIADVLGVRLTAYDNDRDGHYTNVNTGNAFNDKKEYGGRLKFLWTPNADIDVLLSADIAKRDQNCCTVSALTYGTVRSTTPEFNAVTPGPRNTDVFIDRENLWVQDQEQKGLTLEVNWRSGDLEFTSITGSRSWTGFDNNEFDLNPPGNFNDLLENSAVIDQDQFSQEFRVANTNESPIKFVGGLFYFDQTMVAHTELLYSLVAAGGNVGGYLVDRNIDTKSYAAFGQADISITDNLTLLTGLRYTSEELGWDFDRSKHPDEDFPFAPALAFDGTTKDDALSGLLGVQYEFGDQMVYGTWSRGYKGKAVNLVIGISPFEVANGFEVAAPEIPTNFEIGARTEWFDGRVFLDGTLFYTEFEDYQTTVYDPDTNTTGLRNAASLETQGLELNFSALVTDNLTLSGAATFMDTTFADFRNAPCYPGQGTSGGCVDNDSSGTQNTPDSQDASGAPFPNAPDLSLSFVANYRKSLDSIGWDLFADGTYFWQDEVLYAFNGDPLSAQGSYSRANVAIGLASQSNGLKVSLFAKNLFDQEYASLVRPFGGGDPGGTDQILPYDYARVIGIKLDLSL